MELFQYSNFCSGVFILLVLIVLIAIWFYNRIARMSILKRNGIPGETPHLIFGNLFQIKGVSIVERQNRLIRKYGKIVGYYTGGKPNILVADSELANRILIKDFDNFINRSDYLKYTMPSPKANGNIVLTNDKRWKQTRKLLSPAFSPSKLKEMTPIMDESIDSFLKVIHLKSETENDFNIHVLYQRLFLEILMKSAFGVKIDLQFQNNSKLLNALDEIFAPKTNKLFMLLFMCFPKLGCVIQFNRGIIQLISQFFGVTPFGILWKNCTKILKLRKSDNSLRRNDILQSMIDSKVKQKDMTHISESNEFGIINEQNDIKRNVKSDHIQLTDNDIISNSMQLLTGGYDTSSNGLAYVTHILINYPEVQERVRQEVREFYEIEGKLDYNVVTKLHYMEWVINETLRLYPPLINGSTRVCAKDYIYKNMILPKGATVSICTHLLHHDPDYWSEPDSFKPMRFSPENRHKIKSGSWLPFGDGPRNCIAIRLAYFKMKLTLAKLLLEYSLEIGPHSEVGGLSKKYKLLSVVPKNGVFVKAVRL